MVQPDDSGDYLLPGGNPQEEDEECDICSCVQPKKELQGLCKGILLEILLCALAWCSFQNEWYAFAMSMCLAISILLRMLLGCGSYLFGSEELGKVLLFFGILPFLFYIVILNLAFEAECELEDETRVLKIFTSAAHENRTLVMPEIKCKPPSWYPKWDDEPEWLQSKIELAPMIIQFAMPFLFAHMFLQAAETLIATKKSIFQLAILDYADIADYGTILFSVTGHVFFDYHPNWFRAYLALTILAWLSAIAEVIQALVGTSKKVFACISFLFIDLPLGLTRFYFAYICWVDVSYIFLGKNVFCAVYELFELCECECALKRMNYLIGMLPGAGDVDAKVDEFRAKIQRQRSREQFEALANKLEMNQVELDEAKKRKNDKTSETQSTWENALDEKVNYIKFINRLISDVFVYEDMDEAPCGTYQGFEAEVAKAFSAFDVDGSGSLSSYELSEKAFAIADQEDAAIAFLAYVSNERGNIDDLKIEELATYFMKWRAMEDARDFGLPDGDDYDAE